MSPGTHKNCIYQLLVRSIQVDPSLKITQQNRSKSILVNHLGTFFNNIKTHKKIIYNPGKQPTLVLMPHWF